MRNTLPTLAIIGVAVSVLYSCANEQAEPGKATFDNFSLTTLGDSIRSTSFTDAFDCDTLCNRWSILGDGSFGVDSLAKLTENKGHLVLRAAKDKKKKICEPTYVLTDLSDYIFDCRAEVNLKSQDPTERAGITLFRDAQHQYQLVTGCMASGTKTVEIRRVTPKRPDGEILARTPVVCDKMEMRLISPDGNILIFCYAPDGYAWVALRDDISTSYAYDGERDPKIGIFVN